MKRPISIAVEVKNALSYTFSPPYINDVGLVWEKEIYIFGNLQRTGYRDDDN
jgi:hypothetical protein